MVAIFDVDGVLNTGQFLYNSEGKAYKIFGPDDSDALKVLNKYMSIVFISGDKRGFPITEKRLNDMNCLVNLVSTFDRLSWIKKNFRLDQVIYIGDGFLDSIVFKEVAYSCMPYSGFLKNKLYIDYISPYKAGERAVADICFHLIEHFFDKKFEDLDLQELMK